MKVWHEFRDPVHQFITVNTDERRVIDSEPVQRLREVHQLAMSYLVYPGATHRRFEHSLGVMELAGNVFDVLTREDNITDELKEAVPELNLRHNFPYWRSVLRMAALCHDIGHLPFSHAAEHDLLPDGVTHETLTSELVLSESMRSIWEGMTPPIVPAVLAKLAVGPAKAGGERFTVWETILSEIITGDAFGVDRIDYLLRDSLHAGVAYGRFDHHRLTGCLRLMPAPPQGPDSEEPSAPTVGVDIGGLRAAEALLLARYFMFSQVYFHEVRVMYDRHLVEFLTAWLPGGQFTGDLASHLATTDNDVLVAIRKAAHEPGSPAHGPASRIWRRQHFKVLYERNQSDLEMNLAPSDAVEAWAQATWGADKVRTIRSTKKGGSLEFPVRTQDGRVASSLSVSTTLQNLPDATFDRVYIAPELAEEAVKALGRNRNDIITGYAQTQEETA